MSIDLNILKNFCKPRKRNATEEELRTFAYQCERTKLDPFSKQIYAMFRWDSEKDDEIMSVVIGIDGARVISERSQKYAGMTGPFWCGENGSWKDVWTADEPPAAAKVGVLRSDFKETVWGVARFKSYAQQSPLWKKMPEAMCAKCAEMLARRIAFPNDLSGLYLPEEINEETQISNVVPPKNVTAGITDMNEYPNEWRTAKIHDKDLPNEARGKGWTFDDIIDHMNETWYSKPKKCDFTYFELVQFWSKGKKKDLITIANYLLDEIACVAAGTVEEDAPADNEENFYPDIMEAGWENTLCNYRDLCGLDESCTYDDVYLASIDKEKEHHEKCKEIFGSWLNGQNKELSEIANALCAIHS